MKFDIWVFFAKILRKFKIHYYRTRITVTWHEDQYTVIIISRAVLKKRNVSSKSCGKIQDTHFTFSNFFANRVLFEVMWQNIVERGRSQMTVWCTSLLAGYLRLQTYLLTSVCRVLPEELTGLQLAKKFPQFHGTRRFITALTSFRHLSLSWASPVQSIYPHPTSWRYILILSTHLRLGLPSGLFPLRFPHQHLIHPPLLTHTRHMPSLSHYSWFYHQHDIGWAVQII